MRGVCSEQVQVLDALRRGRRHHFDLQARQRRLLAPLWVHGYVRIVAGDYWEITSNGLDLWAARGTLH